MIYYALLAALSDVLSGLLFLRFKTGSTRYIIAFASGVVLSAAFFELIPESNIAQNYVFLGLGFFTFYLIEKAAMLHSCGEKECEAHQIGWIAVVGMASDNIVDGMGIAAGYLTDPALGLMITVAVIAHEIPQGITSALLMKASGFEFKKIIFVLTVMGVMYPVGALLSGIVSSAWYGAIVAFVAGDFIYIGAGDLLAEAHIKFNTKVVLSVLLGGIVVPLLGLLI